MDAAASSLHQKMVTLSIKRFTPKTILKKAKWALHKEKYLNRLIQDITELVTGLVELFPAAEPEQWRLCDEEGTELGSDPHVTLINDMVAEQYPQLSAAIKATSSGDTRTFNITFAGSKNYGLQQAYFSGTQANHFGARP